MGNNSSTPVSDIKSVGVTSTTTSITFTRHIESSYQEIKFYNGREECISLTKDSSSKTFGSLTPNKSYEYSWRTKILDHEWSDWMTKQASTQALTVANNVPLQRISGPNQAIFSVSERDIGSVEKVKVRVLRNNNIKGTFELTNAQRIFTLDGLESATLYTYYWSTQEKGKDRMSQEARGEFYTKQFRDLATIFKDEKTIKKEHEKLLSYVKSFIPPEGNPSMNLVVIGRIGSGKSSFINSVASAVKGKYHNKANTGTSSTSLTQEVRYYRLDEAQNVVLVDLFGLDVTKPGLHTRIIKPLFEGKVPSRFQLKKAEELITNNEEYKASDSVEASQDKKKMKKMGGILFIVDHQSLDNPDLTNKMAQYFTYVQQQGIPYTVVCTQVDTLFSNEKFEVKDIFTSPKVCERMAFFAESMGKTFSPNNVYPFVNYTATYEKRNDAIDVLALKILVNLIESCADRMRDENDDNDFL